MMPCTPIAEPRSRPKRSACLRSFAELERILRRLCQKLGIPTLNAKDEGGAEQISIDTVLARLQPRLRPALWFQLSIALLGNGGWALRHYIAHGLLDAEHFDEAKAACVLHLYLQLGAPQVVPRPHSPMPENQPPT